MSLSEKDVPWIRPTTQNMSPELKLHIKTLQDEFIAYTGLSPNQIILHSATRTDTHGKVFTDYWFEKKKSDAD